MRIAYLLLFYLTILFVTLLSAMLIAAAHPKTARYLADKLLTDNGVVYRTIEGSLLNGITLYDINYNDALFVKRFELKYKFFMLLNPTPTLQKVKLEGTSIIIDKLPKNQESKSALSIPAFAVSKLQLTGTRLLIEKETLLFDLNASNIHHRQALNIKRLSATLATSYGDAKLQGNIRSNRLYLKSALTPKESLIKEHLSAFDNLAKTFSVDLQAGVNDIEATTHLAQLSLRDHNTSLQDADIRLRYLIDKDSFTFTSSYKVLYEALTAQIIHKGSFTATGVYNSKLNGTVTHTPFTLPFKEFRSAVSGDKKSMQAQLHAGPLLFEFTTDDYKHFNIHASSKELPLSFIPDLPAVMNKNRIALKADSLLRTDPFSIKGSYDAEGLYNIFKGSFELNKESQLYLTTLTPKPKSELWHNHPIEKLSPLDLIYYNDNGHGILNLDANILNLTLFKADSAINGWGNIKSGHFYVKGDVVDTNNTHLTLTAKVPSVHTLMSELGFQTPEKKMLFDAQADINATVTLSDKVRAKTRIHLPWYTLQPDTQSSYHGEDVYLEATLINQKITLNRYDLDIKGHHIYSQRPSFIAFDTNGSLLIDEFWVYDNLLVTGKLNPAKMEGHLRFHSDRFNYDSKEGNISLKADIKAHFERDGRQKIEGEVTLLDGVIKYEPKTDYSISDNVIIIQDIKPRSRFQRFVNIRINAIRPINYKVQDINIRVTPDIILWQEPDTPLSVYGMVSIEEGQVMGGGKHFELDKSELYFNGSDPVNPYLNLNIRHRTLNDIDIQIYITNTLSAPVVILASTPAMSQNDIMSYLLFAEPASSAFNTSAEGSKTIALSSLLLATGLKQIFNDTAGVNIDTLNILTNEEGTLGYEIGTRFSKSIRVLYKSDTVSSVILQYSLSRSIRLDVDVHETGQGVTILYVRDF